MLRRLTLNSFNNINVPKRCTHGPNHWSTLKRKTTGKDRALAHFDDLYQSIYGEMWQTIRAALLKEDHKYVAVVNNFGDVDKITEKLQLLGAMDLGELYRIHKENKEERDRRKTEKGIPVKIDEDEDLEIIHDSNIIESSIKEKSKQDLQSLFPKDYEPSENLLDEKKLEDDEFDIKKPMKSVQMKSLEEDLKTASFEEDRIITPSPGGASAALYEYIPATRIKGLDDYVLESEHYSYYTKGADFEIKVEKEQVLNFPKHLKIFTFESGDYSYFPSPRRKETDVLDYYLMNGASILPVLALDLQLGDRVLDMCAAPGGKTLAVLQTLYPDLLVANDVKLKRLNHLHRIMVDYLGNLESCPGKLCLTNVDGRDIDDKELYNKILVDVPCTTDRLTLHEDDNNWFKGGRTKERLKLPEIQTQILTQALKIVAPGGTVVYSTCTLSPVQNEGVVQLAMKRCWEETQSTMVIKNLDPALAPLRILYRFGRFFGFKYGHTILPTPQRNFGPMFFCKIVKVKQ